VKIAQFIDTFNLGGAETMLIRLSLELNKAGHQVIVFHFGNDFIEEVCKKNNIEQVIIPFKDLYQSILTVHLFSFRFAKFLKQHKIELLHNHLYGPITGTFIGSFFYRIPTLGTLHDVYLVQERKGRGLLLRLTQLLGTKLISVSKAMQTFYEGYIPLNKKITTIYNGIEQEESQTKADDPLAEFITEKNENSVRIVTVGRVIPLKQQHQQLIALAPVLKKHNAKLFFVGDGSELEKLQKTIKELSLSKHVFLLGERNDVKAILEKSDIFCLCSESEGLSCSIIEAMSAGLPCVVSDVGGNSELIKDDINGFLYPFGEQEKLKSQIERLVLDKKQRETFGTTSKKIALKDFSSHTMCVNYINSYQSFFN